MLIIPRLLRNILTNCASIALAVELKKSRLKCLLVKVLSNLTLPTDIGNEERFSSHRQRMIEERLVKCYAEEIALRH